MKLRSETVVMLRKKFKFNVIIYTAIMVRLCDKSEIEKALDFSIDMILNSDKLNMVI